MSFIDVRYQFIKQNVTMGARNLHSAQHVDFGWHDLSSADMRTDLEERDHDLVDINVEDLAEFCIRGAHRSCFYHKQGHH